MNTERIGDIPGRCADNLFVAHGNTHFETHNQNESMMESERRWRFICGFNKQQ